MNKRFLLSSLLIPGLALSAPVDEGQVVTLQAGDPARAADLNQTTQALIAAINDNAAQIKSLNEQLSIIASVINLPKPTLTDNLKGSQFKMRSLNPKHGTRKNKVGTNESVDLRDSIFAETGTLTLNADMTSSYVFAGSENEATLYLNLAYDTVDPNIPLEVTNADVAQSNFPDNDTLAGTWSLSGNQLTVNMDGEDNIFWVSMDGNAIMAGNNEAFVDAGYSYFDASIVTGVRIAKPTPDIVVMIDNPEPTADDAAANNGVHYHLITGTTSNGRLIRVQNNGTGVLTLGSRSLIQTQGEGMSIPSQNGPIDIDPGQEITIPVSDADIPPLAGDFDLSSIYLMTNDPDTPTFIVNVSSRSNSAPE